MDSTTFAARLFCRSPKPDPSLAIHRAREQRRSALLEAYAKAYVLYGDRAHEWIELIRPLLPTEFQDYIPSSRSTRERNRILVRRIIGRIKAGIALTDHGNFNGSFMAGLRMSHALRLRTGKTWEIYAPGRDALLADLTEMTWPHRLEKAGKNRIRRLRGCPAAFLPPDDGRPDDQLAGLFAGALIREVEGENWLTLPDTPEVGELLLDWSIPSREARMRLGRTRLLVSPFFGALVAHKMPQRSAERILKVKKPAICPLLSAVYWDLAFSEAYRRYPPFAGCLPFACCRSSCFRKGIKRLDLHRSAVVGLGIIRVDPKLRKIMSEWLARVTRERKLRSVQGQDLTA